MTTRIMMRVCLRAWGHERRMRWALGRKADVGSCARREATETKRSPRPVFALLRPQTPRATASQAAGGPSTHGARETPEVAVKTTVSVISHYPSAVMVSDELNCNIGGCRRASPTLEIAEARARLADDHGR
eukprot:scaffold10597_cov124-Isochrysis_galbana.AAC.4